MCDKRRQSQKPLPKLRSTLKTVVTEQISDRLLARAFSDDPVALVKPYEAYTKATIRILFLSFLDRADIHAESVSFGYLGCIENTRFQ